MIKVMPFSWKKCPKYVDKKRKYSIDEKNPRIVIKIGEDDNDCTIIGNALIPLNKVTSWNIKIINSKDNDGYSIHIGVAPFDIDQDVDNNYVECGWYFDCWNSSLYSGLHHKYKAKEYGPRNDVGKYVHTGDSVGVIMDMTKGELSFVLDGVNYGIAYEGIPLDKPLVPCVILGNKGDSVELMISEAKENVVNSISIPSNITTNGVTWDSITLTWDAVDGAGFYQIEADGSILCNVIKANSFTKRGYSQNTEHSFRVRTVRGNNSVSEWSDAVKGKTPKESFEGSWWKECLDDVDRNRRYSIDKDNLRIATKVGGDGKYCTIIGNASLSLNKATSWSIKILKSRNNDGGNIYIGVAPFDIDQNEYNNVEKCGWYFYCYNSTLCSGPPHNYEDKEYGPRKNVGKYVHTGDAVSVVMDTTTKGDLSFALSGINYGVAYEGILLDKPLVPCVILRYDGDSVELDTTEVKENIDSSISVPSSIIANSTTWDSITLTWDVIKETSFYQIEMDGTNYVTSPSNTLTKRGLFPETEHNFRVRTVKDNTVSEWSDIIKGMALKAPEFSKYIWKECPDYVSEKRKYSDDENNNRIATKIHDSWSTITGNAPLPLNKVNSWNIKVLKSRNNNGKWIYIGIAPFDINQNDDGNYAKCGWYFDCYDSTLCSGPPHNYYIEKKYGPRKEINGEYVHAGDSVGVVMDTTKSELSFVLNGVNYGVAYKGIPLDKPLVSCVLLYYKNDSVELDL